MHAVVPSSAEILRARARALARPAAVAKSEATIELLEFRLADERYAVESRFVREVFPFKELAPLPGTPAFVLGIVNVRGQIVPVYDLKKFFDLPQTGITDLHRIILVEGNGMVLGLLADVAVSLHSLPVESLQPSLPTLTGIRADYLKSVTGDRLIILDLARFLADPRIIVNDEAES